MKAVIINADDYAMDEGVDAAVLDLARREVVTSTSAMTLAPGWPKAGPRLLEVDVDCGLHLDLTSPFAASHALPRSLPRFIEAAYLGSLDHAAVRWAITLQLERFEAVMKAPPRFVDGHQHVHHLPVVREELLSALAGRYGEGASAIGLRICAARSWRGLKAKIVDATGSRHLAHAAKAGRHPTNSDFAGVYDFSRRAYLPNLWRGWLESVKGESPLIMCHVASGPGAAGLSDGIREARLREWRWLGSKGFLDLCSRLAVKFARWRIERRSYAY